MFSIIDQIKIMKKQYWILILGISLSACQSLTQMQNFRQCQFSWQKMENLSIAGINFAGITSLTQLKFTDIGTITTAYAKGNLPLKFTAQVGVTNPNPAPAAMTKLDWIMEFDKKQIAEGSLDQKVSVEPNGGTAVMPLSIVLDLKKIMADRSQSELMDMSMELSKNGEKSSRVNFKVRPYLSVAGMMIPSPVFFDVIR